LVAGTLISNSAFSQAIIVSQATTPQEVRDYVENVLLGSCVTASNITYSGSAQAAGTFDGNGTVLGLNDGVLLTTGEANRAVGPDNANSAGYNNTGGNDADLAVLSPGFEMHDASILEFDFIPQSDTLKFNYIFGSEEYPEYVSSPYNDVFGFFISGPGIAGPFTGGAENIALVPGTALPVAIDNVNNGYSDTEPSTGPCENCAYYVDNSGGPAVQYDGHTTVLTAEIVVTPCVQYHIKIAVADAGDGIYDSGVFLEGGSFSAGNGAGVEMDIVAGVTGIYEGCDIGTFVFRRDGGNNNDPVTVGYIVSGTATPGVDYNALPGTVTIPAGQDSVIVSVQGVLDFTGEGTETIILDIPNSGCSCTPPPSVSMDILDNDIPLALSTSGTITICLGESANLNATPSGSITPYASGWDNGAPTGDNVSVSPAVTTTYTYTLTDACSGQSLTSSETVTVVTPDFTVADDEQCFDGHLFNFVNTGASGGTVTHFWDFGDGNTSTSENPSYAYASAGNYTITHDVIFTAAGCTASADAAITVFEEPAVLILVNSNVVCLGGNDGELGTFVSGGTAPYDYLWNPNGEVTPTISNLSVGNYTVSLTDANGCTDVVTGAIIQNDAELPTALCQNATVQLNASGVATISATVIDNGSSDNCGIASLVVSPNAFSCADLGMNAVVLTVTDINGNMSTCDATVTVEDPIPPVAVCQDIAVILDASGNASIVSADVDNGSTDNCAVQSLSLNQNAFTCTDVPSATVTLTVTDAAGNTATCDANVSITDPTNPTANCQDVFVNLDATGNVTVSGAVIGSGSADNCSSIDITMSPTSFDCSNIGANAVAVTVTDASGNTASCTATVTVSDNLTPDAICQDVTIQLDGNGDVSIVAADVDNASSDNCAIDNMSVSPNTFDCSNIGTNAVVLTVTDVNALVSTCDATVTVEDALPPTAICQDITVALDANGMATIVASQIDNGSTDNCSGSLTFDITPNSFDCTVSAPAQVELTVTDAAGNSSTCTATVTLIENTPPTAVCQDITIQLDATGNASIVGADVDGGSSDNCGIATLDVDPSTFDCSNIGDNTVTLTASDANGNSSTCTAIVTVEDNVDPTAICQDITVVLDANGDASIVAADVDNSSTDNCSISNLVVTPTAFDCSNTGVTTVTLTVTDANGNVSTCTADVTVEDNTPPTALCQDVTVALDATGNAVVDASQVDNSSTDNCAIVDISITPSTFDCSGIGTNQVELTVTDASGNTSTCTATITVEENTPPIALCLDVTVQLDAAGNTSIVATDVDNGSSDNCGITSLTVDPSSFDCSNVGENAVTLTATDASGNSATCSAIVTVEDNIDPAAICQDITIQLDTSGNASIAAADVDGGSSDNCSITNLAVTPNAFTCINLGVTTVTLSVTDAGGNTSTCTAVVTVEDGVDPSAICQDIIVALDVNGNATIVPSQIDNGSSDVCGIANLSIDMNAFDCSSAGLNTVVLTVEDNNGNVSTCSAAVTVEDNINPSAACQNATIYVDGTGSVTLDPLTIDNGSADNCGIATYGLSQSDFTCVDLGQTVVTLTVTDANGNSDDCISVVTILDTIAPVIVTCPADIVFVPDSSDCSPSVTWTEPTVSDNCTPTMVSTHSPGDNFPVGTTTVIYDAEDQSSNTASCTFDITIEPSAVLVSVTSPEGPCGNNLTCFDAEDGEATASIVGGCLPYSFLWSDNQTTQTAFGLSAGTYAVVVTDANGTQATDTVILKRPEALETDSIATSAYIGGGNVSCFGSVDGAININVIGGSDCSNYSFAWTGPNGFTSTDEDLTGLEAGTYTVTVTDASGCVHTESITLTSPNPISVVASPNSYNGFGVSCFDGEDGRINLTVSDGTAPYTFAWSTTDGSASANGAATDDIDTLSAGTYVVVATDANGCQLSKTVTLTEPTDIVLVSTDTTLVSCNGDANGEFVVVASGGVPSYSFVWSNGDIDPILNAVGVGVYEVIVTDINGCLDSLELEMTEPTALDVAVLQTTDVTCFDDDGGSATIDASGGVSPYDYSWITIGQNTQTASDLSAGDYIYEVTDANGCAVTDTVEILQPDQIILVTSNDTTVCPETLVPLSVEASGGGGTYLITWENGLGFGTTYDGFFTQTTNVGVTAIDQNGCESVPNSVIVTTYTPVVAAFTETIVDACTFPVEVDFANNSTNANSYNWTFGNGGTSTEFLPSTVYDTAQTFTVTLIAISPDGCVNSTTQLLTIDPLPEADFGTLNPEGCFPILVGFFNQSTPATSYLWDFGDGFTSDESTTYHLFENSGSYDVSLTITNANGCTSTLTVDSAVFAFPRPTAEFMPIMLSAPEPGSEFQMINNSLGAIEYQWTFGDGGNSTLTEPLYDYPEHGSYTITLRATNEYGCSDTARANVFIELTSGLFVPNAVAVGAFGDAGSFLPKGDGIGEYHAWVYDKWGNLLWESTELFDGSPAEGWDGRYKGEYVPQGAYVWKINAIFKDGEVWEGMLQSNGKQRNTGSVTVLF
jgi:PKD repeat protein